MSFSDDDYDDDLMDDWEAMADEEEQKEADEKKRLENKKTKHDIADEEVVTTSYVDANAHLSEEAKKAKSRAAERAQDAANAAALFGGTAQKMVDINPSNEAEFADYAKRMALLLQVHQQSEHFPGFVKKLTEMVAISLKKEQLNDLERVVKVAHDESTKARKAEEKRGAQQPKKATAVASRKDAIDMDVSGRGGGIAADAEEDFM